VDNNVSKTLKVKAGILFVLGESGSMSPGNFEKIKGFVKDVIQRYP